MESWKKEGALGETDTYRVKGRPSLGGAVRSFNLCSIGYFSGASGDHVEWL
jgi:hypothetical protein